MMVKSPSNSLIVIGNNRITTNEIDKVFFSFLFTITPFKKRNGSYHCTKTNKSTTINPESMIQNPRL